MFERFTEGARKVVVLAQEEAWHFNHNYIGAEHLLLGLLRLQEDEGIAARVLSSLNITLSEMREQVGSIVGYGEEGTGGQKPFTPRAKKILEFALREALDLGHNYIGTEHILLGLVRESEGTATRVLLNLGVDLQKIRSEVMRMLGKGSPVEAGRDVSHSDQEKPQPTFFERFTEGARKVVVLAREEAQHFNHNDLDTEHILLGLLREDEGIAARVLSSLNITLDEVREQVGSIVGYGEEETDNQIPFTSRVKKVLEFALREARDLGHDYIGTEHILLGLVRQPQGIAMHVLSNLDVDPQQVRREVVRVLESRTKSGEQNQKSIAIQSEPKQNRDPSRSSNTEKGSDPDFLTDAPGGDRSQPGQSEASSNRGGHWISGLAAMLAGAVLMVTIVLTALTDSGFYSSSSGSFSFSAQRVLPFVLLLLVALPGFAARQLGRIGCLGLAGFLSAMIGGFMSVGIPIARWLGEHVMRLHLVYPTPGTTRYLLLTVISLVGGVALLVGLTLFSIATDRAGVLPRWAAGMLARGLLLTLGAVILIVVLSRRVWVQAQGGLDATLTFLVFGGWEAYPRLFWLFWGGISIGLGIFAIGLIGLGYALWSERSTSDQPGQRPARTAMRSTLLIRWSGLAAMLTGIVLMGLILTIVLTGLTGGGLFFFSAQRVLPFVILLLVALLGLAARQDRRFGRLGLVGLILAIIGAPPLVVIPVAAWIVDVTAPQLIYPTAGTPYLLLTMIFLLGGVALLVGLTLFGISTARAGILPRWAAGMFALGFPLALEAAILISLFFEVGVNARGGLEASLEVFATGLSFWLFWGDTSIGLGIFAIGLIGLGYALWSERGISERSAQSSIRTLL